MSTKIIYMVVDHSWEGSSSQVIKAFDNEERAIAYKDEYIKTHYSILPLHKNPKNLQEHNENYYRSGQSITIETSTLHVMDES